VLGVFAPHLVDVVAHVLASLESEHALVVHSEDGLDEISISAPTRVAEVRDGEVRSYTIVASEIGVESHPLDSLAGGDAPANAAIARRVLSGEPGAPLEIVIANAGAALYASGAAASIRDGVAQARESIATGRAAAKLEELIDATR
jgi:anthranilate phosphoribosyltransferase